MTELKEIIKVCKDNKIDPWYVEEITANGGYELADEGLLSYAENDALNSVLSSEIRRTIKDVYFNEEVAELPVKIKKTIEEAIKELDCSAWGMVKDWTFGISDFPFDDVMCDWIGDSQERALEVYNYILNKELQN